MDGINKRLDELSYEGGGSLPQTAKIVCAGCKHAKGNKHPWENWPGGAGCAKYPINDVGLDPGKPKSVRHEGKPCKYYEPETQTT